MKYYIAAVAVLAFTIAIFAVAPQASVKGNLKLSQIETTSSKKYPTSTKQDATIFVEQVEGPKLACNWFCEQASSPDEQALAAIVVK